MIQWSNRKAARLPRQFPATRCVARIPRWLFAVNDSPVTAPDGTEAKLLVWSDVCFLRAVHAGADNRRGRHCRVEQPETLRFAGGRFCFCKYSMLSWFSSPPSFVELVRGVTARPELAISRPVSTQTLERL